MPQNGCCRYTRNQSLSPAFTVTGSQTLGNITGTISDNCVAAKHIVGATLQLLIPPDSNSTADCLTSPEQCVAVATANTDNAGNFPLPGTITVLPQFENVPVQSKSLPNKGAYVMEITAPGYDNLFVYAIPTTGAGKKGGGTCSPDGAHFHRVRPRAEHGIHQRHYPDNTAKSGADHSGPGFRRGRRNQQY